MRHTDLEMHVSELAVSCCQWDDQSMKLQFDRVFLHVVQCYQLQLGGSMDRWIDGSVDEVQTLKGLVFGGCMSATRATRASGNNTNEPVANRLFNVFVVLLLELLLVVEGEADAVGDEDRIGTGFDDDDESEDIGDDTGGDAGGDGGGDSISGHGRYCACDGDDVEDHDDDGEAEDVDAYDMLTTM
jgi:hypothetical protein